MAELVPVDHDPFSAATKTPDGRPRIVVRPPQLVPVEHDPFAKPGYTEDIMRSADAGLAKGIGGLIGLPGTVAELGAKGLDWATQKAAGAMGVDAPRPKKEESSFSLPTIDSVHAEMEANQPFYKSQTGPGQVAGTVAEFIPGAVAAPGGIVANALKYGVGAGLASEGAGNIPGVKGTQLEPIFRVGGALVGGGAAAIASRPNRTAQTIRQQMPEGVTPQMVDEAQDLIIDAAQRGVALSWPEALSQAAGRPVLTNTMRHLEASPQSEARMAEFFGNRPQQVDRAAGQVFDQVTPAPPNPSEIGPAVGRAAEGTISDVGDVINRHTRPLYQAAEQQRIPAHLFQQVRNDPVFQEGLRRVRADEWIGPTLRGLPDDSVAVIDAIKKQLDETGRNLSSPTSGTAQNNYAASIVGGGKNRMVAAADAATGSSPTHVGSYELARTTQAGLRERFLQPLLDGPLGKLAKEDITTQNAINALFPKNPLPNSAAEIDTAVRALAHRNQYAARSLVRAHIESVFNQSSQDLIAGANQAGGAKFRANLVGNPQQAANLEAAIRALPNGDQVWPGIDRFLQIMQATGTRQNVGSRTAYNLEFDKALSASGLIGESSKAVANPLNGVKFLADRYERWTLGQNLDGLARVFTDPQAANVFRSIARMPPNSSSLPRALYRITELSESAVGSRKPPEKTRQ